ncbi:thioredoxin family protein [Mycoplasmopsis pullorum]|uniref:Thioredoxin n=1 Tax=Mycoplasmopsis pullorum TaxID=48003 RepID=A0A1L4FRX1_9BACT|nr:thioredoxin family protein [Mycoplasmopsis pullorum]APJ38375.1 thiol reductase thioredoxin [Mycoplasmopsis pullorum]
MLKEVVKSDIQEDLKKGLKVLVFHATWCGPCRMYKKSLEELSEKIGLDIYRVDVDKDQAFAAEMGVNSIPATFVYKEGSLLASFQGYRPYEQLNEEINTLK